MAYFSFKDVSLLLDRSAETVTLAIGLHSVVMSIGEWSKLVSSPSTMPRVTLADKN